MNTTGPLMSRHATSLISLLLAAGLAALAGPSHAQFDARAQQQRQQQDQARQQQQEQARRQQEEARRQQQEQLRQQMQQQQRQQMQQQMQQQRDQMQQQQREQARQQQQEAQRQMRQQQGAQSRQQAQEAQRQAQQAQQAQQRQQQGAAQRGSFGANAGPQPDRRTFSNGVSKSYVPPTNAQLAKGYTGKQTEDGRALVKFQGRVLAVPASRIGVKPRQPANDRNASTASSSSTTWSTAKQNAVRADVQKLAGSPPGGGGKGGSVGGSGGGLSGTFNAAARARVDAARAVRMGQGAQMTSVAQGNSREDNGQYDTPEGRKKGWSPPHSTGSNLRNYVSQRPERFVRVYTEENKLGGFMVREKEIAHLGDDPKKIRAYLGLEKEPTHIGVVEVPANTKMKMSVIGPQPNFEKARAGGYQYIVLDRVSEDWFKSTRELKPSPTKH